MRHITKTLKSLPGIAKAYRVSHCDHTIKPHHTLKAETHYKTRGIMKQNMQVVLRY